MKVVKSKLVKKRWFMDVETYSESAGRQVVYLICIVGDEGEQHSFKGPSLEKDFFTWFNSLVYDIVTIRRHEIWTFNGCKFDYLFFLPRFIKMYSSYIIGDFSNLKMIRVGMVKMLDYRNIVPFGSLSRLAIDWKVDHKKGDFNHALVNKDTVDSIITQATEYCFKDCIVLKELFQKFSDNLKLIDERLSKVDFMTISGLSLKVYKMLYLKTTLHGLSGILLNQFRESYFGGYVCTNRKYVKGEINYYDINSSYPYRMTKKLPVQMEAEIVVRRDIDHEFNDDTAYYVDIFEFNEDVILPYFPVRCIEVSRGAGLIYPLQDNTTPIFRWGFEINMAKSNNHLKRIRSIKEVSFRMEYACRDYIEKIYAARLQSKAEGNESLSTMYKLLMNSLSGKFGQKTELPVKYCNYDELMDFLRFNQRLTSIVDIKKIDDGVWSIKYDPNHFENPYDANMPENVVLENEESIGTLVYIIGYITAGARIELVRHFRNMMDKVIYCDTDSIFFEGEMMDIDANKLGALKRENTKPISEIICLGPKMYMYHSGDDDYKFRFKGVKQSNSEFSTFEKCREFFMSVLQDKTGTTINKDSFRRFFGGVVIGDVRKNISLVERRIYSENVFTSVPFYNKAKYLQSLSNSV